MNNPTIKELRLFGLLLAIVIVFWLLIYWASKGIALISLWPGLATALLLAAIAIIYPRWLKRPYLYWMKGAHWLNRLVTATTLACCFFVIITPTALIKRALGHDSIFKPKYRDDSYKQNSEILPPTDMEHPF
jgi:Saxitoxin biosynthesis operon protein SxtJ